MNDHKINRRIAMRGAAALVAAAIPLIAFGASAVHAQSIMRSPNLNISSRTPNITVRVNPNVAGRGVTNVAGRGTIANTAVGRGTNITTTNVANTAVGRGTNISSTIANTAVGRTTTNVSTTVTLAGRISTPPMSPIP